MADDDQKRIAVLIDADNASATILDDLLREIANYGVASVKRIYGDWTRPNLGGWKKVLQAHAIEPIQQFAYTTGKNATDSAMIIDAMDLLNTGRYDAFCIVSSDSDFTRLATRIREDGLMVFGFGERKTPQSFVSACDRFIYTDILGDKPQKADAKSAKSGKQLASDRRLASLLRGVAEAAADESGWVNLGTIGSGVQKQAPEFDARNYGYKKLLDLIEATGLFEIDWRAASEGGR